MKQKRLKRSHKKMNAKKSLMTNTWTRAMMPKKVNKMVNYLI